jgi:hypothetical protein
MTMLSEDDLDLEGLSDEDVALAWDLWFDLAQTTNDTDPPYSHGVFQLARIQNVAHDVQTREPAEEA